MTMITNGVCSKCGGSGILVDPDPLKSAIRCSCFNSRNQKNGFSGIPPRYEHATIEKFWAWWITEHPQQEILAACDLAHQLLSTPVARATLKNGLDLKLSHILEKSGYASSLGTLGSIQNIKYALQPSGFEQISGWAQQGNSKSDFWWISGAALSGKSTLASALMKARCERTQDDGLFISGRSFSQELKNVYYDVRSYTNRSFQSERTLMEPLEEVGVLVIDDFDRLDTDKRLLTAFAQLLDHRYSNGKPTIMTALEGPQHILLSDQGMFAKVGDESLLRRLEQSQRVVLKPILKELIHLISAT